MPVRLSVLDYTLSRGRPDLGQLIELLDVRGIYVYTERVLRLILYRFQGGGVDDPRRPFRKPRRVQCAAGQYDHDQHRYDHLRPVARERTGGAVAAAHQGREWPSRKRRLSPKGLSGHEGEGFSVVYEAAFQHFSFRECSEDR